MSGIRTTVLLLILPLTLLSLASPSWAEVWVYDVDFESPVFDQQTFEFEGPDLARSIESVKVRVTGDFDGFVWLCNLETPDPFTSPCALAFSISGGEGDTYRAVIAWWSDIPLGPIEKTLLLGVGPYMDFLTQEAPFKFTLGADDPGGWDCFDRCPHGCSNVSGFGGLHTVQLIIQYNTGVSAEDPSWGMLKARW